MVTVNDGLWGKRFILGNQRSHLQARVLPPTVTSPCPETVPAARQIAGISRKASIHGRLGSNDVRLQCEMVTPDEPMSSGSGTVDDPWRLKTPPLTSDYTMHRDNRDGIDVIVCTVGKTVLLYDARCLDDLHAMLTTHGDWMELGSADEQKPAKNGTVEAWARSPDNPIGGWYGLKKGLRGRFAMYVPPLMEHLGRAEVEHNARGNRMRAL
jgi:hypothetical protein